MNVTVTPEAKEKIAEMCVENDMVGIRAYVYGGGCSGMQYGMAMESEPREFDTIVDSNGVKVVIDPTSLMYMSGSSIDYVAKLMVGGFIIDNPQAVAC